MGAAGAAAAVAARAVAALRRGRGFGAVAAGRRRGGCAARPDAGGPCRAAVGVLPAALLAAVPAVFRFAFLPTALGGAGVMPGTQLSNRAEIRVPSSGSSVPLRRVG